ncbi:uncharacterized protein LOC125567918 [Nematostella vectensis]|uniref:uncharacterized protein LOC125567918 n=1 Tax=Nematostella vectensis TaxID=45351 RepID=UPI0020775789|nr:uncharacterized protein LOC125567918 [Nematostella vectensis]
MTSSRKAVNCHANPHHTTHQTAPTNLAPDSSFVVKVHVFIIDRVGSNKSTEKAKDVKPNLAERTHEWSVDKSKIEAAKDDISVEARDDNPSKVAGPLVIPPKNKDEKK